MILTIDITTSIQEAHSKKKLLKREGKIRSLDLSKLNASFIELERG